jgi:hypothetical protein
VIIAGEQSVLFNRVTVDGVKMSDALSDWWAGVGERVSGGDRGGSFAEPCIWYPSGNERRCNPTCYHAGLVAYRNDH